jgi:hypothetical protein
MPRLFFDEPLSEELCETLADIFPVRPTTLRDYCGAITTTSFDSTSRAKRQSSSWAEYNRRPNTACSRRRLTEWFAAAAEA